MREIEVQFRLSQAGQKEAFLRGMSARAWQMRILPRRRTEEPLWQQAFQLCTITEDGTAVLRIGYSPMGGSRDWLPEWGDPEVTVAELLDWQQKWVDGDRPGLPPTGNERS